MDYWPIALIIIGILVIWYVATSWNSWGMGSTQTAATVQQAATQVAPASNFVSDGLKGLHLSEMSTRTPGWRAGAKVRPMNTVTGLFGVHFESHRRK